MENVVCKKCTICFACAHIFLLFWVRIMILFIPTIQLSIFILPLIIVVFCLLGVCRRGTHYTSQLPLTGNLWALNHFRYSQALHNYTVKATPSM